jgi:hypothetical protein
MRHSGKPFSSLLLFRLAPFVIAASAMGQDASSDSDFRTEKIPFA